MSTGVGTGDLRESVRWFACAMEQTLRANDWKGGWQNMTPAEIINRLREEADELFECFLSDPTAGVFPASDREIIKEATDVVNFAMFLADNVARRHVS